MWNSGRKVHWNVWTSGKQYDSTVCYWFIIFLPGRWSWKLYESIYKHSLLGSQEEGGGTVRSFGRYGKRNCKSITHEEILACNKKDPVSQPSSWDQWQEFERHSWIGTFWTEITITHFALFSFSLYLYYFHWKVPFFDAANMQWGMVFSIHMPSLKYMHCVFL